jgi:hypothetical protein
LLADSGRGQNPPMCPFLSRGDWFALLGPLPDGIAPERKPVAAPGVPGAAPDSPIAGWESLTFDLSAPPFGLRAILVTLDADGTPISASDHVFIRDVDASESDQPVNVRHESVGGRIESDGSFRGTHWLFEGPEPPEDHDGAEGDTAPWVRRESRALTAQETARLLQIVNEVLARA